MCIEKIFQVGGIPADFSIKVDTARFKASVLQNNQHRLGNFKNISGKLVGIPSVLIIAPVGIDAAQHIGIGGYLKFMFKGVLGQDGMVHLNIDFKIFLQAIFIEKTDDRGCIEIVLVFGGLHRLWLNQESTLEAVSAAIIFSLMHKLCQMISFPLHICIEERHIALTSAPEHIILAA